MMDDLDEKLCPDCGANMSQNEDGEWECDGPDCTAHLDRMNFDDEDE